MAKAKKKVVKAKAKVKAKKIKVAKKKVVKAKTKVVVKEPKSKSIGVVTHWFDHISVAVVKLSGGLAVGDKIKVKHGEVEFEDSVVSMQLDHVDIPSGKKGQEIAIKIANKAKEGSTIEII